MPRRIVLVVIDTLRADALPFHGADREAAPFLAELAESSLVFERAWAASSWTAPSTASIFTSRYPNQHGVEFNMRARPDGGQVKIRRIPAGMETLPAFLRAQGYATFGASANVNVGPRIGFDHFELLQGEAGHAEALVDRVLEWKEELLAEPRSFLYLHLMDPHPPFIRRERWMPRDLPQALPPVRPGSLADRAAYHSEVGYLDEALRRLFRELELPGDAVVFVTSDHGEEFFDHGGVSHGFTLYSELTHVPLLLRLPGADAPRGRIAGNVSNLDILPTLRSLLGAPPSPDEVGRSLLAQRAGEGAAEREIFVMRISRKRSGRRQARVVTRKRAALQGRFKLIVTDPPTRTELYDVVSDPAERRNLAAAYPERVRELGALLDAQARSADSSLYEVVEGYRPSVEEARLLEELGYVED